MKQSVRLIACDMDGTLIGTDGKISADNAAALKEAADAGIRLCIASGRHPEDVRERLSGIPVEFDCIGLNGAVVQIKGYPDKVAPLTKEEVRAVFDIILPKGIAWTVVTRCDLRSCYADEFPWLREKNPVTLEEAFRLEAIKLMVMTEKDRHELAGARKAVEQTGLSVSSSWMNNFEVNAPGIDKGTALAALAERMGIAREEVMAIGDYDNDRSMIGWAGASVAMGNALPEIKALAKYTTLSNAQDGVANAIRRWAL